MKLLLDTHVIIWASDEPLKLSQNARTALRDVDNDLYISAATIWELSIKVGIGKLSLSGSYRPWLIEAITTLGLGVLPVTIDVGERQTLLPRHHGDPFDRWLVAQSFHEAMPIVSADTAFDAYGVVRLWN